jgi:hypothetical protein
MGQLADAREDMYADVGLVIGEQQPEPISLAPSFTRTVPLRSSKRNTTSPPSSVLSWQRTTPLASTSSMSWARSSGWVPGRR